MRVTNGRKTAGILFDRAEELGLEPKWLTNYGAFTITFDGKNETYFQSTLPFNNVLAGYLTNNKHLTRIKAAEIGEQNIPYCFPQSLAELQQFFEEHGVIIAKPTRGSGGDGVIKVSSAAMLGSLPWQDMIFERYIPGNEWRVLALDNQVLGVAKKTLSPKNGEPWHKHWAIFAHSPLPEEVPQRAVKLLSHFGLRWGAVDFIEDKEGTFWLLEANYSPGFVHFHQPDDGEAVDIAGKVWQKIYPEKVTL